MGTRTKINYNQRSYSKRNKLLQDNGYESYQAYLASPLWAAVRKRYRSRPSFSFCKVCGSKDNIELHHFRYNAKMFRLEQGNILMALCRDHHQETHDVSSHKNISFKMATRGISRNFNK